MKKVEKVEKKTGPHLSCDLHNIGANIYSKFFRAKKYGPGWMGDWMDVKVGLRIAYSNKKKVRNASINSGCDFITLEIIRFRAPIIA